MIEDIMRELDIELWGFCEFDKVRSNLINCRAINRLPTDPHTIICVLFPYKTKQLEHNISRYAIVQDYHEVVLKTLNEIIKKLKDKYKHYDFEPFVDNSPIPEVKAAALCGLGVIGDNNLLINNKYGSWVFIGEIVTNMEVKVEKHEIRYCLHCGACKLNCPGNALLDDSFLKQCCASNLSQVKRDLTHEEEQIILKSGLVWGCDSCQDVCPMNKNAAQTNIEGFKKDVFSIIKKDDYDLLKNRAFHWRPKRVIERNIDLYKQ